MIQEVVHKPKKNKITRWQIEIWANLHCLASFTENLNITNSSPALLYQNNNFTNASYDNYAMCLDNNERKPIFNPIPIAHFNTLQKNGGRSQYKGKKNPPC